MADVSNIIANNIRDLRKSTGMTQSDLASQLGYTVQAISRWEKGKSLPDPVMLYKLADLFHVGIAYFYQENHIEIDPEKEKIIRKREAIFRFLVLLAILFSFGVLGTTIILLIDVSAVHIVLWVISFIAIAILLLGLSLKRRRVIIISIPMIIITLITSLYFSLKAQIPNLKFVFIPMVAILLFYVFYVLFFQRK